MTPFCELQVISYKVHPAQISQESFKAHKFSSLHFMVFHWATRASPKSAGDGAGTGTESAWAELFRQRPFASHQKLDSGCHPSCCSSWRGRMAAHETETRQIWWKKLRLASGHLGDEMGWDGMGLVCCFCCVMSEKQWLLDLSEIFSDIA